MKGVEAMSAPRRACLAAGVLLAACACVLRSASAGEVDSPEPGGSSLGQGASLAGPILAPTAPLRLDGRMDGRVDSASYAVDNRIVAGSYAMDPHAPSQEIPYRVEPNIDGRPANPWDLPPEKPDPRDFEETDTFDAIATPHYTLHEEIWNNVEDLITADGFTRYGGLAYVPFWARNTIRYGRWSFFPFVHAETVWASDLGQSGNGKGKSAWEFMASGGLMAEYFADPRTKVKAALRADYRTFTDVYDDAYTYVAGVSVEHQFGRDLTLNGGVETERSLVPYDLLTSLGGTAEQPLFQREKAFVDLRWDRFPSCDWRFDVGGAYSWVDEVDGTAYGGDYEQLDLYGRVSVAVMRHEGFAYLQYGYAKRNAEGNSSDLDYSNSLRLGVDGIQPFGRTRRIVGDMWIGWQSEKYTPSTDPGSVGDGGDDHRLDADVRRVAHLPPDGVHQLLPHVRARHLVLGDRELQHHGRHLPGRHPEPLEPARGTVRGLHDADPAGERRRRQRAPRGRRRRAVRPHRQPRPGDRLPVPVPLRGRRVRPGRRESHLHRRDPAAALIAGLARLRRLRTGDACGPERGRYERRWIRWPGSGGVP